MTEMESLAPGSLGRPLRKPREVWLRALDPVNFIRVRKIPGGPALEAVQAQMTTARKEQAETQEWLNAKRSLFERYPQLIYDDILSLKNAAQ